MSSAIVEIHCFVDAFGEYIVKEMSLVDMQYYSSIHWIFKPPKINFFNTKSLKTNCWLTKNLHFLKWKRGYVEYDELTEISAFISSNFTKVYTKGLEKARFLKRFGLNVINVEELGCRKLDPIGPGTQCIEHNTHPEACTHYHAYGILAWLNRYK
jgi:hypothetical protein